MSSKCQKSVLAEHEAIPLGREVPLLAPAPPRLYPEVGVPPGSVPPVEQSFLGPNGPFPYGAYSQAPAGHSAACGPPPYCEHAGCGNGLRHNNIGVRYFVHNGPPAPPPPVGEFHAIHGGGPSGGGAAPVSTGETVFYYVSSSSAYAARGEPSFMFMRRRPLSYASLVLFCVLGAVFLMVFLKMHADLTRKYLPPSPPPDQLLMGQPKATSHGQILSPPPGHKEMKPAPMNGTSPPGNGPETAENQMETALDNNSTGTGGNGAGGGTVTAKVMGAVPLDGTSGGGGTGTTTAMTGNISTTENNGHSKHGQD